MKKFSIMMIATVMLVGIFSACGDQDVSEKDYTAQQVFDTIKEAYGKDFLPDGDMSEEEYTEVYGLNMDDIEDIKAQVALVSFHPDRLIVVKAAKDKGEDVEKALISARDDLVENGLWYPANLAKVNASAVARNGDYVAFIMLGAVDERTDVTEEQAAEFADKEVQKGVEAFAKLF